jgi:hypothetical protein
MNTPITLTVSPVEQPDTRSSDRFSLSLTESGWANSALVGTVWTKKIHDVPALTTASILAWVEQDLRRALIASAKIELVTYVVQIGNEDPIHSVVSRQSIEENMKRFK